MNCNGNAARPVRFWRADPYAGLTERLRWQSSKLQSRVGLPDSAPFSASVAYWLGFWPPARGTEFDSPRSLQFRVGSSMGEPWSCKPVMRVRFSRSTKCGRSRVVQAAGCEPAYESSILSGHPICAHRPTGKGTRFLNERSAFESLWAFQHRRSSTGKSGRVRSDRFGVRISSPVSVL